jgi:exopolysaccharide biosynthesis polyprenyl glycosylphosphotransferase
MTVARSTESELRIGSISPPKDRPERALPRVLPAFSIGGTSSRRLYIEFCQVADTATALLCILVAFLFANREHMPTGLEGFLSTRITLRNALLVGLFLLVWRLSFGICGLYEWRRIAARAKEFSWLVAATALGSSFTLVFVAYSATHAFHAGVVAYFWVVATCLALSARTILRRITFGWPLAIPREAIIVGSGPRALRVYRQLSGDSHAGYRVIGFVDSNEAITDDEIVRNLLGDLDQLESILMRQALDEVVIALPMRSCYRAIQDVIQTCERVGVRAKYLADVFPLSLARPRFEESPELPAIAMAMAPDDGRLMLKRLIDICGSVAGLIVLAPVMLLTALAIKLTSPGPVIFAQERFGFNRRRFRMYKFRTMTVDAEACQPTLEHLNEAKGPIFKIRNDPRITGLGKLLRRSSIDELPQLYNVLRGDMTLVGPRPMAVRDVTRFTEAALMRRFSVRPGLTCLWQIGGRSELSFDDWMRLDLEYIDQWSLRLDLRILVKTIPAVLRGVGAT